MKDHHHPVDSALSVHSGIDQPPSVDPKAAQRFIRKRRSILTVKEYIDGIVAGNRTVLSRAITLIESRRPDHANIAQEIVTGCLPYSGRSIRIGITGVPGVGKSSFIEVLGSCFTKQGKKLAVLAIDPSSERSKGSILGDKTRMEQLSNDPAAFIRPSPAAGSLGGVARKTRETMILCEAAGFDVIFIETVGVGQSETAVHSMVDFFLLLMLAGAGDELQGIKRGIMEMADTIAITKADGDNARASDLACMEYRNALHLFPPTESGWIPRVIAVSARENQGLEILLGIFSDYFGQVNANGFLQKRRMEQSRHWMYTTIHEQLLDGFYHDPLIARRIKDIEKKVMEGRMTSFQGATKLIEEYHKGGRVAGHKGIGGKVLPPLP
ncbi:MAG: methylmalonyl Co-A mutase-associated GTPase MeaB [Bacteroidia bacterium]|nr:methylmalonyl Co-A mutase-associated GTPase MeaB [Bacteroidia bacterium]